VYLHPHPQSDFARANSLASSSWRVDFSVRWPTFSLIRDQKNRHGGRRYGKERWLQHRRARVEL